MPGLRSLPPPLLSLPTAPFLKGDTIKGASHRGRSRAIPKHVQARAAQDEQEERQVHKLARSHHAPADWKFHAQMVVESWAGKTPNEIAPTLHCHPKTVRIHLARFNAEGISGLSTFTRPFWK
jgi:hypothetical protein